MVSKPGIGVPARLFGGIDQLTLRSPLVVNRRAAYLAGMSRSVGRGRSKGCLLPKTICRIEVSNNARITLPRWHVIGTKGTLEVKGFHEPVWDQAEIVFVGEDGRKESRRITLHDVKESGIEGGFYEDLIPFINGKKKEFVSMYEAAKVVKVLELIKKSSDENKLIAY